MNRYFYWFAIGFSAISILTWIIQWFVQFEAGLEFLSLDSLPLWILFIMALSAVRASYEIRYYYTKGYKVTFYLGLLNTIIILLFLYIRYKFVAEGAMAELQLLSFFLVMTTFFLFGLSMAMSKASERRYLKASGIVVCVYTIVSISVTVAAMSGVNAKLASNLPAVFLILTWFEPILLVLLILNFGEELRTTARMSPSERSSMMPLVPGAIAAALLFVMLAIGNALGAESNAKANWYKQLQVNKSRYRSIFDNRRYGTQDGDTLKYQLLKPSEIDSTLKYPLVVCLPFTGGVEGAPPAEWLLHYRQSYPCFLFVPECPEGAGWGGIPNYPTLDTIVFNAIKSVEEEFTSIDRSRCYVTGVSRGGFGSWHFATLRPDLFAAVIPVCGGGDSTAALRLSDVDVWAFHGAHDRNVPVERSRSMIRSMRRAGLDPKYTEYPDERHSIWELVKTTPGLLEWLFNQRKDSVPEN